MTALLVLYEDSRGANGMFGPHDFFLGCVADITNTDIHQLKPLVRAYPTRGVDKLLGRLEDLDNLAGGAPILAILDDDHVRERLQVEGMTASEIATKLKHDSSAPSRLSVVLLERNLESVVQGLDRCGEREKQLIAAALKKRLNERDTLLGRVGHDAARRAIRDCVRKALPCVEQIVQAMRAVVA